MQARVPHSTAKKTLTHLSDNTQIRDSSGRFFPWPKYKECTPDTGVVPARFPKTLGNLSGDVGTRLAGHDTGPQGPRPPSATRGDSGLARALRPAAAGPLRQRRLGRASGEPGPLSPAAARLPRHPGPGPAAYLREPGRLCVQSSGSGVWSAPPPRGGRGSGRRSHSARPQPRGRGPGQPSHRRSRTPHLRAHTPKPGQLALFGAQEERQGSLRFSRSFSSYSRHLRWRPQRPH